MSGLFSDRLKGQPDVQSFKSSSSKDNLAPNDPRATEPKEEDIRITVLKKVRAKASSDESLLQPENEHVLDDIIFAEISKSNEYLPQMMKKNILDQIKNELFGYGPLEPLLRDDLINEIMVVGPKLVYIEKEGKKVLTDITFNSAEHLLNIIDRIIGPIGRKLDESSPMVDARLPQGFRVNAVRQPIALNGPFLTIRKFPKFALTYEDLIKFGSAPAEIFMFLETCVLAKKNVAISGSTGSGKTTLLNVLSNFIPPDERLVVLEDCHELNIGCQHVLYMESRPANIEGRGEISIKDMVKNSLRMRPDRIIVGEVRSVEAFDMLQAMNTGHDGSLTTGHANSPIDFLRRLESMVLNGGIDIPLKALREQIASAIHIVVQISRIPPDNKRKIIQICEVQGLDEMQDYKINPLFQYKQVGNEMKMVPINFPSFFEQLDMLGLGLPREIFES